MRAEKIKSLFIGFLQKSHNFMVDLRSGLITTVQNSPSVKILALYTGKTHQTEFFGHTVLCDHRAGNLGRFLNIVGCTGRDRIENDFFRRSSAECHDKLRFQFLLGIEILLFFRNIHYIAESTHRPRYDRNLLDRLGILLKSRAQSVTDLMIGHNSSLLHAENTIFLFLTDKNDFHCLQQILLAYLMTAVANRKNSSLVDHIGQVGSDCAACS